MSLATVVGGECEGVTRTSKMGDSNQKFCQNRSISLRFRDKLVFAFYAEIQDGHQKWRENDFWEKSLIHSGDTLQIKNSLKSLYRALFWR